MAVRVLHVTQDHSARNTGVTQAVETIAACTLGRLDSDDAVAILAAGQSDRPPPEGARMFAAPVSFAAWRWAPGLGRAIDEAIAGLGATVVHVHALWMAPQALAMAAARRRGIPTVVSAHGLVTRYALGQPGRLGALKKRAYLAAIGRPRFSRATVLHAITAEERAQLAGLFPGPRVVSIPNAVDVAAIAHAAGDAEPGDEVLFLGRIHPLKGVDLLIDAFARGAERLRLTIAGPRQDAAYAAALEARVERLGLGDRVRFTGPIWGEARFAMMRRARVVVVPSHSEVMSLVNLEAAACATPSITTTAVGLDDWEEGGGLVVPVAVPALAAALEKAAAWSAAERRARGEASRSLVAARYSTAVIGARWAALYRELAAS